MKRHSSALTEGPGRAPARAMLKAVGFSDDDLARPIVGVATCWIETMPCNFNHRDLAAQVKAGIRAAGGSDGVQHGIDLGRRDDGHGGDAALRDGDVIEIDVDARDLRVKLSDEDIDKRLADWSPPAPRYRHGVFSKYAASVASASEGAVTRPGWPSD